VAAAIAKDATKQFICDLKERITTHQLELLLGAGPTLAIAIDTTGSMGSIIQGVKAQAIQIVNSRLGTDEEPVKYVLSPFNDPGVGPLTVTTKADEFKSAINALTASGGGDCPELAQTGMLRALAAMDEGGELFMFTDATAKDDDLSGEVDGLAAEKNIQVYPILFGSCSPIDPSYIRVANDSGGQLFFLSRSEAGSITKLADFVVRSNSVNLFLTSGTFAGSPRSYSVPVDSTVTRVTFSASGATSVVLTRPGGVTVQPTDPGVTFVSVSGGKFYSIANPAAGEWGITVNGVADFSVKVSGESPLDLSSFRFVEPGGRPGHEGYFPIDGLPLAGQEGAVDAVMSGDFGTPQFELRSRSGATLQTLALSPVPETTDEFFGHVTPPNTSFISPTAFSLGTGETVNVAVRLQPPPSATPGTSDTLTVNVASTSPAGSSNFAVVTSVVTLANQPPDTSAARPSITTLEVANHKLTPISIAGVTDPDGDPVTIRIDRIAQDEPSNGRGDGDACPDAFGVGMPTAQLRAERAGTGNGRVYTIFFTASDDKGGAAQGSVKVFVPHNQGASSVDDGPSFDATSCP
jgi:hypothetical protein